MNLAHLASQSIFSLCSAGWLLAAVTSSEEGNYRLSCDSHGVCARSSQSFQASLGLIPSQTLELEARNKKWILFAQPQIQEQIVEVVMVMLQELVPERVLELSSSVSRTRRKLWCTIRDQEPGYQPRVTSARVDIDTLLVQKELSSVVASLSVRSSRCFRVSSRSSPVPSLALRMGQMINATAINAVPVLEDVCAGTTRSGACGSMCVNTGKTPPGSDTGRIDRLTALSCFHGWCRVAVLNW